MTKIINVIYMINIIYHCSSVVDFSSEKYIVSTVGSSLNSIIILTVSSLLVSYQEFLCTVETMYSSDEKSAAYEQ